MSFWTVHGIFGGFFYVIFFLLFPRLTIFATVTISAIVASAIASVGITGFPAWLIMTAVVVIAWVMWFAMPRVVIAVIALYLYSETNPVLCIFACILGWINGMFAIFVAPKMLEKLREKHPESGLSYLDLTRLAVQFIWDKFRVETLIARVLAKRTSAAKVVPDAEDPDTVHLDPGKTNSTVINLREVRDNYEKALRKRK